MTARCRALASTAACREEHKNIMKNKSAVLRILAAILLATSTCYAATTIQGTVRGPGEAPIPRAFVQTRNLHTKITTMVLSDDAGHYQISHLPPGKYEI